MKRMNRVLSVILVILLAAGIFPIVGLSNDSSIFSGDALATECRVGDIIQFGSYPQSEVTNDTIISNTGDTITFGEYPNSKVIDNNTIVALNKTSKEWHSYRYYSGDGAYGSMQQGDWMQYTDVTYNGSKYRGVKISQYRPYWTCYPSSVSFSSQAYNGYTINNTYWFKWEPLKWRVLDPNDGLIVCEKLIDCQAYCNEVVESDGTYYNGTYPSIHCNNYAFSSIRNWLNSDFYDIAFSEKEKDQIVVSELNNGAYSSEFATYDSISTCDNIFLLSYSDAINTSYGFITDDDRVAVGTDYAKCQGIGVTPTSAYSSSWLLRSAGSDSYIVRGAYSTGRLTDYNASYPGYGIRPACRLKKIDNDTSTGFELGRDNNSFRHSNGAQYYYDSDLKKYVKKRDSNGNVMFKSEAEALANNTGFYLQNNYQINDEFLLECLKNKCLSSTEEDDIIEKKDGEWGGSCYGIAETIGMVYLGYQDISDITSIPAEDFYNLELPYKNQLLSDTINYYYLSQFLNAGSKKSYGVYTYKNKYTGTITSNSNSNFWKNLIDVVAEQYMVLLGFGEEDGSGHAIVTCGVKQESENKYVINLYDENGLCESESGFHRLEIIKTGNKYEATYMCEKNNDDNIIDELTYVFYLPLDSVTGLVPTRNKAKKNSAKMESDHSETETMEITIPFFGEYEVAFDDGTYIRFEEDGLDATADIIDMRFIIKGEQSFARLTVDKKGELTMTSTVDDITVFDENNYYSVEGDNIDEMKISFTDGITMQGENYSFIASIDCNENEVAVKQASGSATNTVIITDKDNTLITGNDNISCMDVCILTLDDKTVLIDNEAFSEVEISPDGTIVNTTVNDDEDTHDNPSDPTPTDQEKVCKYCNQKHDSSLIGRIVALIHSILWFFKNLFK